MMLTASDFTSNEDVDNIQTGDTTVDIVGYVMKVNNNFHSPRDTKFHKFVINNGNGREVQVIAWNRNTKLLQQVKEMGSIVYIGSAKAIEIKNKLYNSGNMPYELLIKDNSTIEVFGAYQEFTDCVSEEVTIVEAYKKINKKIKLEAIMKSEFKKYKNRDFEYVVASVTDTMHKLELKVNCDCSALKLKKGCSVQLIGIVEQFPPGPPVMRIDKLSDIQLIERERIPFVEILKGFKNKF